MEIEKNILTDDDSDTDYDCDEDTSSDSDDENFTRKFGDIKTKTSCQGKVQIKLKKDDENNDEDEEVEEEMDDFEAEMEKELAQRVFEAETKAAIANNFTKHKHLPEEDDIDFDNDEEMPSTSKSDDPKSDKYSDIYFDSDEEEGDQRKMVSNDDLFYDPHQDAEDQTWVDSVRQSYQMSKPGDSVKKLPNSDAVLNCPACFAGNEMLLFDVGCQEVQFLINLVILLMSLQLNKLITLMMIRGVFLENKLGCVCVLGGGGLGAIKVSKFLLLQSSEAHL